MDSLIQKGRRLKLLTDIMLKLFDSCVAPILLYGCEVWGYENTDIIEKVHTKFCKFIFCVSTFSHNMPIYGELGRYPLSITIKQRMICYWTRILKSNQHKLNKVMYDILYNLHCKDIHSSGWIKCINTIFQNNGMSYIWATQDCKVDSNKVHECECDQFKGGVLVEKLFCSFFNPAISLYIYYDQYEKIWRKNPKFFFPMVGFHGNGGHIRF